MPINFYGCFSHETCGSEDCSNSAKFEQKQRRIYIVQEMLTTFNDESDLLKTVITGDEPWKACQVRSNVKVFLTVFFDCNDVLDHKFLSQGRKVNKE